MAAEGLHAPPRGAALVSQLVNSFTSSEGTKLMTLRTLMSPRRCATLAVAATLLSLVVLAGCASTATANATATAPSGAPTATATASPTSAGGIPVLVYFSKHPESENNFAAVFSVQRTSPDQGVATFAIKQLILGPSPAEQATGLYTELTAALTALSGTSTCGGADFTITLDKKGGTAEPGTATLKFCRPTSTAGIGADARITAEIDQTLRQFSTIHKIVILTSTGHCFGDESGLDICLK
jgi:hypothetical protein